MGEIISHRISLHTDSLMYFMHLPMSGLKAEKCKSVESVMYNFKISKT